VPDFLRGMEERNWNSQRVQGDNSGRFSFFDGFMEVCKIPFLYRLKKFVFGIKIVTQIYVYPIVFKKIMCDLYQYSRRYKSIVNFQVC